MPPTLRMSLAGAAPAVAAASSIAFGVGQERLHRQTEAQVLSSVMRSVGLVVLRNAWSTGFFVGDDGSLAS